MTEPASLNPDFVAALQRYQIELPVDQAAALQQYAELVWEWNEKLNMTRHTTWDLFVGRDLLDSVHLASVLEPKEQVLDLGSGAGVPGIPLAILRPDVSMSLAESVGKRAKVLDEMVAELQLPVSVYAARGEDILEDFQFDTITARAVGSLHKLCTWLRPHFGDFRRMLLLKGPRWIEERSEARHLGSLKGLQMRKRASYPLPGAEGESVILELWKQDAKSQDGNSQDDDDDLDDL